MMIALLLAALTAVARPVRYHVIAVANDQGPSNGIVAGAQGVRGVSVRELRSLQELQDGGVRFAPLRYAASDAKRAVDLFRALTDDALMELRSPGGDAETVPTVANVERAFRDTGCRIARLKGRTRDGCAGIDDDIPVDVWTRFDGPGQEEDVVFVFYSGHGLAQGLLLADDLLPMSALDDAVDDLGADLVVVILDACFGSGADAGTGAPAIERARDLPDLRGRRGVATFASANTVLEVDGLGSGALTHIILSGLSGGADADRDALITYAEMEEFFWMHAERGHQFVGRPSPPGRRPERALLDLDAARAGVFVSVPSQPAARVLFSDDGGAARAEHAARRRGGPVRYLLPLTDSGAYGVTYLGVGGASSSGPARHRAEWVPETGARLTDLGTDGPPSADPGLRLAAYMERAQRDGGLFSAHGVPWGQRRLEGRLSLGVGLGMQSSEAWARIEDEDVDGAGYGYRALLGDLQRATPERWNLAHLGLVERLHPLAPFHIEVRQEVQWTPRTQVSAEPATLVMGRANGGVGVGGWLGSRRAFAWATGGAGVVGVEVAALTQGAPSVALPRSDRTPWTAYAALGATLVRPGPDVAVEVLGMADNVELVGLPPELNLQRGEVRTYLSLRAALVLDLGVLVR